MLSNKIEKISIISNLIKRLDLKRNRYNFFNIINSKNKLLDKIDLKIFKKILIFKKYLFDNKVNPIIKDILHKNKNNKLLLLNINANFNLKYFLYAFFVHFFYYFLFGPFIFILVVLFFKNKSLNVIHNIQLFAFNKMNLLQLYFFSNYLLFVYLIYLLYSLNINENKYDIISFNSYIFLNIIFNILLISLKYSHFSDDFYIYFCNNYLSYDIMENNTLIFSKIYLKTNFIQKELSTIMMHKNIDRKIFYINFLNNINYQKLNWKINTIKIINTDNNKFKYIKCTDYLLNIIQKYNNKKEINYFFHFFNTINIIKLLLTLYQLNKINNIFSNYNKYHLIKVILIFLNSINKLILIYIFSKINNILSLKIYLISKINNLLNYNKIYVVNKFKAINFCDKFTLMNYYDMKYISYKLFNSLIKKTKYTILFLTIILIFMILILLFLIKSNNKDKSIELFIAVSKSDSTSIIVILLIFLYKISKLNSLQNSNLELLDLIDLLKKYHLYLKDNLNYINTTFTRLNIMIKSFFNIKNDEKNIENAIILSHISKIIKNINNIIYLNSNERYIKINFIKIDWNIFNILLFGGFPLFINYIIFNINI